MKAIFFDRIRHAEALTELATASLACGEAQTAFMFADRRCRIGVPKATHRLLRARALKEILALDDAVSELEAAAGLDPTDVTTSVALLEWGRPETRLKAARRLVANGRATPSQVANAVNVLLERELLVASARFVDRRHVAGWVVAKFTTAPALRIVGDQFLRAVPLSRDESHFLSAYGSAFVFDEVAPTDLFELQILVDEVVCHRIVNYRRSVRARLPKRDASPAIADHVLAIVPVYDGLDVTTNCLAALKRQNASIEIRIIVVDDCSPDPRLRAHLEREASAGAIRLIRDSANFGFAGAVNEALKLYAGGDILLLNSDVILPPGSIERLRAAVWSSPRIGTATPFSNNGEFTSFPVPFRANPMPTSEQIAEIDQSFQNANRGKYAALPNGIGFCLYVKRDCFEAVGPLSTKYGRGYGEDIEFCLTARSAGFLNVCATDVFVGHAGGESFGDEKRELVVRNLEVLEASYPEYRAESAAFLHADPLKSNRARVELSSPPSHISRLIVDASGARSVREARLRAIAKLKLAGRVLVLARSGINSVWDLHATDAGSPQSLTFDTIQTGSREALARYLSKISIDRVEWIGMRDLDEASSSLLASLAAPVDVVYCDSWPLRFSPILAPNCASPEGDRPCRDCKRDVRFTEDLGVVIKSTLERISAFFTDRSRTLATDPMAAAYADRTFPRRPKSTAMLNADPAAPISSSGRPIRTLGILIPDKFPEVERLVKGISRSLAAVAPEIKLAVFGETFDDLALMTAGNAFVTGDAGPEEYERLIGLYGVEALFSPYRSSHFWLFAEVGKWGHLPKAYFDWSLGLVTRREGDLALDPRSCDTQTMSRVRDWLRGAEPARKSQP